MLGRDGGRHGGGYDDGYGRDAYGDPDNQATTYDDRHVAIPYEEGDRAPARHMRPDSGGDDGADGGRGGRGEEPPRLSRRGKPIRSRGQRIVLAVGGVVILLSLCGASAAGYLLSRYNSIERVQDIDIAQAPAGEPENFLLVGSDDRTGTADEGQVSGRRTDTIMVVRVDPASDRLGVLSFPRDLIVTISATGENGMINSAYSMENGEQVLIDTIAQNYGIPIHHYVEVNFNGFQQLVDSIGGVSLWIPNAIRDQHSGLFIEQLGCVNLQGEQALQFARSRYLDYMTEDEGWERDPQSDVSRVQRQQVFIRRAMAKALAEVQANPLRMRELIDIGVGNVRLDDQMGVGDILDLAEQFRDFGSERLETYPLPTLPHPTQGGRLVLDDDAAEPMLNVFRGLDPSEVGPGVVTVQVVNGTDTDGFANDISGALQAVGFDLVQPTSSADRPAHSIVYHAPGQANYGLRVARHLTGGADVVERPELEAGHVELLVGADFSTVHQQPTPVDQMPTTTTTAAPGAPAEPATTTTTEAPATTTTTSPPPTTSTTVTNGYVVGEPPPGTSC